MKIYQLAFLSVFLLLASCTLPPQYTGQKLASTSIVDIYYSANEVKRPYKVIGHFAMHKYIKSAVEKGMVYGGKKIGADAVIILGADSINKNLIDADALKYD